MFVDLILATDTFFGTTTSPAKLFARSQHICNCNFTLTISIGPQKRLQRLRNGVTVSQGLVLAILLLNIYTLYLIISTAILKKFIWANCWLNVIIEGRTISSCIEPTYLDVWQNSTLPFRRHLESLRQKLTLRARLVRLLVKSSWGAVEKSYAQQPLALSCSLHC